MRTLDGVRVTSFPFSERYFLPTSVCSTLYLFGSALAFAHVQTETYQVPDVGPTHGTDGPLKVSTGALISNFGEQFLQVARALDPARAKAPPDTDTNDLSTINVYTVGIQLSLSVPTP